MGKVVTFSKLLLRLCSALINFLTSTVAVIGHSITSCDLFKDTININDEVVVSFTLLQI